MRDPTDESEHADERAASDGREPEDDDALQSDDCSPEGADGPSLSEGDDDSPPPEGDDGSSLSEEADGSSLPEEAVAAAERLTRLAREAVDESEADAYRERRDQRLAGYGYTARVREEDETLVCHPDEWVEDGTVRFDRIEDRSRAVEIPLSGPGDPDDWDALDAANRELVEAVRDAHGPVHGANAAAFADFMGNHCARAITDATAADVEEFRTEYFVRNAWPSDRQRALIDRSIELCLALGEESATPDE